MPHAVHTRAHMKLVTRNKQVVDRLSTELGYRRAAEQGYASAQTNLGFMYGKGHGLPQNYVLAHMWYNLAALQGEELSLDSGDGESGNRDKIARRMTPAQIARAQELAAQCLASNYQDCAE